MEINDLAGLSEPLTKLIEVVSKGIGIVYEPINIKRMAKAKAKEIKTISSAMESSELPIQYNNGQISIDTSTKEFIERTERRMLFIEEKKQKNIEDVIDGAYENLENEKSVSQEPLQEEWINRFFNIVGEIGSEDLKVIWSKILSEEIKEPGKCSIRTLEVLKNLSRSEAEIFKKISDYIMQSHDIYFLPNEAELLESLNISYEDILKLDEAQLINSSSMIRLKINFNGDTKENSLVYNNYVIICKEKDKSNVEIYTYTLTKVGREIFNILLPTMNESFLDKYMDILKSKMNVSRGQILEKLPDGGIRYIKIEMSITEKKE